MSSGLGLVNLSITPDSWVLGFTAAVSLLTGILFGLSPALRSTRVDLTPALKEGAGRVPGAHEHYRGLRLGLGKTLVVTQVALSLLLLVGAGLFVRTLANLQNVDAGFNERNLVLFSINPTRDGYKGQRLEGFYESLHDRLKAIPGVRNASLSSSVLISGGEGISAISIPGYTPQPGDGSRNGILSVYVNGIGDGFFETMGIPLLLGRTLNPHDIASSSSVAVVNEVFARNFFAKLNPVGRHFKWGSTSGKEVEIVGVVGNTKYTDLRQEVPPTVYYSYAAAVEGLGEMNFELRTAGNPKDWTSAVRDTVEGIDKGVPLLFVKTQVEQINQTLFQEPLFARLTSFLGLLAALLGCVGVYGIMAFATSQRTREIGIRMALGANRTEILGMVLRETSVLVAIGIAAGTLAALGASRLVASFLFGLKPNDPVTIAGAALLMVAAALAGYLPARRASRVDPIVALRYE